MTRRTVMIVCAKAPRRIPNVPAVQVADYSSSGVYRGMIWQCSWCGARVKVGPW